MSGPFILISITVSHFTNYFDQMHFLLYMLDTFFFLFLSISCMLGPYFVQVGALILKLNYHIAFHNFVLLTNILHVHVVFLALRSLLYSRTMFPPILRLVIAAALYELAEVCIQCDLVLDSMIVTTKLCTLMLIN